MAISRAQTGKYIGYTWGGRYPTLYFENGHFTQYHDTPENEGWHPNPGTGHQMVNLSQQGVASFWEARDNRNLAEFIKEVLAGEHLSYGPEDPNAVLLEWDSASFHVSRSKFVSVNDSDGSKFSETYVDQVLKMGRVAPNEFK